MPLPISLGTVPVIAFLGGLYSGQGARGTVLAMVPFAAWVWFYHRGDDFPADYDFDLLINWFFASLLAGLVGAMMTLVYKWHPLMDGAHLSRYYEKDGKVNFSGIGKLLGKLLVVLAIFAGSHIIYELRVTGFPKPWGGVVASVGIILGWIIFGVWFRSDIELFESPPPGSTGYHRFTRSEVAVYALFASLTHVLYFTAYWLTEYFWNPATWIVDQWYFYFSLIYFGGIGIIMLAIGLWLIRSRDDLVAKYRNMPANPETPAEKQYTNGSPATMQMKHRPTQSPVAVSAQPTPVYINPFVRK